MSVFCSTFTLPVVGVIDMKPPIKPLLENYFCAAKIKKSSDKFLFLVSDADLYVHIISVGFRAICLENEVDVEEFISRMEVYLCRGTQQADYIYVLCCATKKCNDKIKDFFSVNFLNFHEGWSLFRGKEYLRSFEHWQALIETLNSLVTRYEPQEQELYLDSFHHMRDGQSGETGATGAFDSRIREHLLRYNHIFVCGCPYVYRDGFYQPDFSGTKLKSLIEGYLYPKFQKSQTIRQIYNLIVETDSIQRRFDDLNQYPDTLINFRDCMVDVRTMEEIPHSPEFYAINQIPFSWKEIKVTSSGTEIEKFFDFIFTSADDRKMFLEFVGLCFTKDSSQQRFLTLCGVGGTGKSVLIRLVEAAVGRENISNVSLQELSKRFNTSLLVGKLLNSCADLSAEMLDDAAVMKKLLGEDRLFSERKGENGFMFSSYAKLLFSTNALPIIQGERTNGFYRRLMILRMDRQPRTIDTGLFIRLEAELPYFIKLAVQALHEMYARGGVITISSNSEQAVRQMWKDGDVVQAWLDDCCTLEAKTKTDRAKLFSDFEGYCSREDRQALSKNGFYKALRSKNFTEVSVHGYSHFQGVKIGKTFTQSTLANVENATLASCSMVSADESEDCPFT